MTQTAKMARTGIQWACLPSRRPMSAVSEEARHRQDQQQRRQRFQAAHCFIASYSSTSGVFLLR